MSFTASVVSVDHWGARPPKNGPFPRTIPRYIVIHHTDTSNPPDDFSQRTLDGSKSFARSIQRSHMDENGWSDSGHNFLNTTAGILLEGRHGSLSAVRQGQSVQSAHAKQDTGKLAGGNESPGIENEGNFTTSEMSDIQWSSLVKLCASICSSCSISPANIRGHRDFSDTDCPGDWLYARIGQLRKDVALVLAIDTSDPSLSGEANDVELSFGSIGLKVVLLQDRLREKGFPPGASDGVFGDNTRSAVICFQKSVELRPDGIVGRKTKAALGL